MNQINVINQGFAGSNFSFYLSSIDRTNNSNWSTHIADTSDTSDASMMMRALALDPATVLNLYICDSILARSEFGYLHAIIGYSRPPRFF